jgi:hypothetical protein
MIILPGQRGGAEMKAPLREYSTHIYEMMARLGIEPGAGENQASAFREQSMSLAEETIANTLDCGVKLLRLREPQELTQIHTDFWSRQTQAIADRAKRNR